MAKTTVEMVMTFILFALRALILTNGDWEHRDRDNWCQEGLYGDLVNICDALVFFLIRSVQLRKYIDSAIRPDP